MKQTMSRREMLYGAGGLLAATAARAQTKPAVVSPVMTRLSTFMSEAAGRSLPADVVEKTRHMILDTLAAMISGSELPPGRFAVNFARAYKGNPIATVAGSNVLCGPIEAALANGILAHSDETDDTHPPSMSHPGCATIPAALAAGERFNISGRQFLRWDGCNTCRTAIGARIRSPGPSARRLPLDVPPASMPGKCAGCFPIRRSRRPEPPPGSATPITSRRRSISPECPRATA
jgi:hypothetical protein